MRIKTKPKEQTVMESRNTSIAIFASAAIIPILLTMLIGFNFGNAEKVNNENLRRKVDLLNKEADSLHQAKENVEKDILLLHKAFEQMDSILIHYQDNDFKQLNERLSNLSMLSGTDQTIALQLWDNDKSRIIDKFKVSIEMLNTRTAINKNLQIKLIQNFANKWLDLNSQTMDNYLFLRKIAIQQDMGSNTTSSLEQEIERLKETIQGLKNESTKTDAQVINLQGNLESGRDGWKKEREGDKEHIDQLQKELAAYKDKTKRIKGDILSELDAIHEQTLPELIPKRWLQKNDQQINVFKKGLEFQLSVIQRHVGDLN